MGNEDRIKQLGAEGWEENEFGDWYKPDYVSKNTDKIPNNPFKVIQHFTQLKQHYSDLASLIEDEDVGGELSSAYVSSYKELSQTCQTIIDRFKDLAVLNDD